MTKEEAEAIIKRDYLSVHHYREKPEKDFPEWEYWSVENRYEPWWETLWCRVMYRHRPFEWFKIPCIGCKILGKYHEGVADTLEEAVDMYLCDIGECTEACEMYKDCKEQ